MSFPSRNLLQPTPKQREELMSLYRYCFRCAQAIADGGWRASYLEYVKDSFRRHQHIPFDSPQAKEAREYAEEQLQRMNYYHSVSEQIRKERQQQQQQQQQQIAGTLKLGTLSERSSGSTKASASMMDIVSSVLSSDYAATDNSNKEQPSDGTSSKNHIDQSNKNIMEFLDTAVPYLQPDDVQSYALRLVQDGFDSVPMITNQLQEEDLHFMKKAHKRALLNAIRKGSRVLP